MPRLAAHVWRAALMFSEPLSTRMLTGWQRHSMICSSVLITRRAGGDTSISIPSQSLPIEVIKNIQGSEAAAILKLV